MLLNDFFDIQQITQEGNTALCSVSLNLQHSIYSGHFPGNPVTPGVVQIQMVKELLEQVLNQKLSLLNMPRCKFLAVLDPRQTPQFVVKLEISKQDNLVKVNASGEEGEQVFFKLSAVYQ